MTTPPSADARLDSAQKCVRQRDYPQAISLFEQVIADDDRNVAAHEGLAMAAFMTGDYSRAAELYKRVTLLDPRRAQPLVNLGAVHNRAGEYQEAAAVLRKALSKDRKCAEAYYNLGLAHRGLGQSSMAVSAYKEAIRLEPEMAEAHQNLANVYSDMGNLQQAILHYEQALQLRPGFERARRGLERARASREQRQQAVSPFGRLVDAEQTKAPPRKSLRTLTEQQRYDDRLAVHKIAKQTERAANDLLGQMQKELEAALLEFTRAFAQSQDARGFWEEFGSLQSALQNFDQLDGLLKQAIDELRDHEQSMAAEE